MWHDYQRCPAPTNCPSRQAFTSQKDAPKRTNKQVSAQQNSQPPFPVSYCDNRHLNRNWEPPEKQAEPSTA